MRLWIYSQSFASQSLLDLGGSSVVPWFCSRAGSSRRIITSLGRDKAKQYLGIST